MTKTITIGKREFIQHTSKYLKLVQKQVVLTISHQNHPVLQLTPIHKRHITDLKGLISNIKVHGDINEPVLPGLDQW